MSLLSPPLEAFWAVVRKGTVQDASKILGLTQTGVTQRIRSLEKQLKTTLFTRSRKGMKLTVEGEALLQFVKNSIELEGMALSKIQGAAKDSITEISICGSSSILQSRVIPNLSKLTFQYPKLRFRFDISDVASNADKLKSGDYQFALLHQDEVASEMDSKILRAERYRLYGPASWKRRLFSDIIKTETLIQKTPTDQISFYLLDKYKLKPKIKKEAHFTNNLETMLVMTKEGLGFSVLSEEFASPLVKKGLLTQINTDYFFDFKVALAWYPRHEMPDYFKAIIKAIV